MPTPTEFWFWNMRSETTGKVIRSVCRLTEADALKRDPAAMRIEGTCKVIEVQGPGEYKPYSTTDVGMRDPTRER